MESSRAFPRPEIRRYELGQGRSEYKEDQEEEEEEEEEDANSQAARHNRERHRESAAGGTEIV